MVGNVKEEKGHDELGFRTREKGFAFQLPFFCFRTDVVFEILKDLSFAFYSWYECPIFFKKKPVKS